MTYSAVPRFIVFEQRFAELGSQIGDDRPISQVRFSPNSQILVTGSWSGNVKLWNIPNCTPIRTLSGWSAISVPVHALSSLSGHTDRVGGVAWHPQATLTQSEDAVNLVSGAGDMNVNLWSLNRYNSSHTTVSASLTAPKRDPSGNTERPRRPDMPSRLPSERRLRRQRELRHLLAAVGRRDVEGAAPAGGALQGGLLR